LEPGDRYDAQEARYCADRGCDGDCGHKVRYEGERPDANTEHACQSQLYQTSASETTHRSRADDPYQSPDSRGSDQRAEGPGTPEARLGEDGSTYVQKSHHGQVGTEQNQ
jgi:hypothetical protein